MKLLDEIIDLAASEQGSVATLLRKCLVLAHDLKNDRLKVWAENELKGYPVSDDPAIPDYRKTNGPAKGFFLGPFGAQIDNQPIPPAILQPKHRDFAQSVVLAQPIAAYEDANKKSIMRFEWPANLIGLYQSSFFEGTYALNRAWQEVPGSVFIGVVDTVKTRVLTFALELKDDLGEVHDHVNELPKEKIDRSVTNIIYGGNVVIASSDFTQIGRIEIVQGDWTGLSKALKKLGVPATSITELRTALDQDAADGEKPALGERAKAWLGKIGLGSGKALLSVGVEVAKAEAKKYIFGYLGLPPPQ